MMENDDQLIKNFLLAGKQEIEDNGFSRRVIGYFPSGHSGCQTCSAWHAQWHVASCSTYLMA